MTDLELIQPGEKQNDYILRFDKNFSTLAYPNKLVLLFSSNVFNIENDEQDNIIGKYVKGFYNKLGKNRFNDLNDFRETFSRIYPTLNNDDDSLLIYIQVYNYYRHKCNNLFGIYPIIVNGKVIVPKRLEDEINAKDDDLKNHKKVLDMEDIGKNIEEFDKNAKLKIDSKEYNEGKIQIENEYDDIKENTLNLLAKPTSVKKTFNSEIIKASKNSIFSFADVNRTSQGQIENLFTAPTDISQIINVLSNYNYLIINDQVSSNYLTATNNFSINKINILFDIARIPVDAGEKTSDWINYLSSNPLNNFSYVQFHLPFNTIFTKLKPKAPSDDPKELAEQICDLWRDDKIFKDIISKIEDKKTYYKKLIVESVPGILSENILKKLFKIDRTKQEDFNTAHDNVIKILSTFGMTRIYTNFIFPALEALKLALSPGIYIKDGNYIVDFKTLQLPTIFFGLFMKFKKEILKNYHIGKVKIEKTSTRDQIKVKRDAKTYDEQDEIREKQKKANAENDLTANVRSKNDLSKTHVLCSVDFNSIDNIIKNFVDLICIFPFDIKFNCFNDYEPVNIINYSKEDYTKKLTIKDQVSIYMKSLGFTNGDILGKIMFVTNDSGPKLYKIEFNYNSIVKRWIKVYKHKDIIKFIVKPDFTSYMFYFNIFDTNLLKSIDEQIKTKK